MASASTNARGRAERSAKPKPNSSVGRFYERERAAGAPTPIAFMAGSRQTGPNGESDPVEGADTSMFDPSDAALLPLGVRLPDDDPATAPCPTLAHAYVVLRVSHAGYPPAVAAAVRAMSLAELQAALRKREWAPLLYTHRASMPADSRHATRRGWSRAQWQRRWYEHHLPRWYRRPETDGDADRATRAYQAWKTVTAAAAAQNPAFARAVCATGTRTFGLRNAFFANPRKRAAEEHGETDDVITAAGAPGVYGLALADLRAALRAADPVLAAQPDAYAPFAHAPHAALVPDSGTASEPQPEPASVPEPASRPRARRREPRSAETYAPSSAADSSEDDAAEDVAPMEVDEAPVYRLADEGDAARVVAGLLPRHDSRCKRCETRDARIVCSACLQRAYCSYACQRAHWDAGHETECAGLLSQRPRVRIKH